MTTAADVVQFWQDAGPKAWFARNDDFDADFRNRFLAAHELAAGGGLHGWMQGPEGALALMILLDQFPRNAFRGSARMFATDALALELAESAIRAGHDRATGEDLRIFFYLPFEHSELPADQQRAVELIRPLGGEWLRYAIIHQDVIVRFGRFPHRNELLGRVSTPEELAFLQSGGFAG